MCGALIGTDEDSAVSLIGLATRRDVCSFFPMRESAICMEAPGVEEVFEDNAVGRLTEFRSHFEALINVVNRSCMMHHFRVEK